MVTEANYCNQNWNVPFAMDHQKSPVIVITFGVALKDHIKQHTWIILPCLRQIWGSKHTEPFELDAWEKYESNK